MFTKDSPDGKLNTESLNKVLRMLGQTPSEDEIEEIIRDFAEGEGMRAVSSRRAPLML